MTRIDPLRPHSPGPLGRCPDCPEDPAAAVHTTFPRQVRTVRWTDIKDRVRAAGGGTVTVIP